MAIIEGIVEFGFLALSLLFVVAAWVISILIIERLYIYYQTHKQFDIKVVPYGSKVVHPSTQDKSRKAQVRNASKKKA